MGRLLPDTHQPCNEYCTHFGLGLRLGPGRDYEPSAEGAFGDDHESFG